MRRRRRWIAIMYSEIRKARRRRWKDEEYMNRKQQEAENAEVSILIITILTIGE